MRYCLVAVGFFLLVGSVYSQNGAAPTYLEFKSKRRLYYVELSDSHSRVYAMGSHFDIAGSGFALRHIDTLIRQTDGNYSGSSNDVVTGGEKIWLVVKRDNPKRFLLSKPSDRSEVIYNLNNAYCLDAYIALTVRLNQQYPMQHTSFRGAFSAWKNFEGKELGYEDFKRIFDARLHAIEDSMHRVHDNYTSIMNRLIENLPKDSYDSLKAGLRQLPAVWGNNTAYFGRVVNEVSKQKPQFYFLLATDFPSSRDIIFASAEDRREVIERLRVTEGDKEVKREFFKDRRFNKSMPYKAVGLTVGVIAMVTYLIVR